MKITFKITLIDGLQSPPSASSRKKSLSPKRNSRHVDANDDYERKRDNNRRYDNNDKSAAGKLFL